MVTEHCMWTPSKTNVADGTWSGSLQSPCPPRDLRKGSLHAGAADDLQNCEGTGSQGHDLFVLAPCARETSLSTCAGTGTPTHTTHLPRGKRVHVTAWLVALLHWTIYNYTCSSLAPNMCLLSLLGELRDLTSVRKCRIWQPSLLCH